MANPSSHLKWGSHPTKRTTRPNERVLPVPDEDLSIDSSNHMDIRGPCSLSDSPSSSSLVSMD